MAGMRSDTFFCKAGEIGTGFPFFREFTAARSSVSSSPVKALLVRPSGSVQEIIRLEAGGHPPPPFLAAGRAAVGTSLPHLGLPLLNQIRDGRYNLVAYAARLNELDGFQVHFKS